MIGFDPDEFPYCIAKGMYGILLIDIKHNQVIALVKLRQMQVALPGQRLVQMVLIDERIYPGALTIE